MKYHFTFGTKLGDSSNLAELFKLSSFFEHFYIIGKTGMGKSVLMEKMAHNSLKNGFPVIYIEPKGESVNKLYSIHRKNNNVKYISFQNPIKINPLRKNDYSIDRLIREFTDVMDIMITSTSTNPETTVRMKQILSKSIKGFKNSDRNLNFLHQFLTFKEERKKYKFEDTETSKWFSEIESTSRSGYKNANDYLGTMSSISSRLSQFIDNDEMSQFISNENELDINDMVENGQSLLINTNTSDSDNQKFLSSLIIYAIVSYIKTIKKPKPLFVFVDEFQTCVNNSFTEILMFGRGKQVSFTLAHHDFLEVSPKILNSILGIVNNYIVFRTGYDEAKRLSGELKAKTDDIINLPKYQAFLRLGTEVTLIETFPPKMKDVPEIFSTNKQTFEAIPEIYNEQKEEQKIIEHYNFLGDSDSWISL